jgi:uncharacterized protein (TIGR02145 family)
MKKLFPCFMFLAAVLFSCTAYTDESTNYCVYQETRQCFSTSQSTCAAGGELSDFCPFSSSSVLRSSSSAAVVTSCDISGSGTVNIGSQVWMVKNLNCNISGSKCYNDDPANCTKYGRLYNWATAMALPPGCNSSSCTSQISAKHKGICPSGWHIPSDAEWTTLIDNVGGSFIAGTKLKAASGWNSHMGVPSGTDEFNFSALPGGNSDSVGSFDYVGDGGDWWGATETDADNAYRWSMHYSYERVHRSNSHKSYLLSVRCLQN